MGRSCVQTHRRTNRQTADTITRCPLWIFQVNKRVVTQNWSAIYNAYLNARTINRQFLELKLISKIYQKKLLTPPPPPKKKTKQNKTKQYRQTNKAQTIEKIMRIILLPFENIDDSWHFCFEDCFFKYDYAEYCRPIFLSSMVVFCLCSFIKTVLCNRLRTQNKCGCSVTPTHHHSCKEWGILVRVQRPHPWVGCQSYERCKRTIFFFCCLLWNWISAH